MQNYWRVEKIVSVYQAARQAEYLRSIGKKIVTVNGSFDVLHGGHISLLEEARQQGEILFVGLNSDKTIREGKGERFPIVPEDQRAAVLAAMICVDYVVMIDAPYGTTHDVLLETVRPAIHVNCSEFGEVSQWAEYPVMEKYNVKGHLIQKTSGVSDEELRAMKQ